MELFNSLVFSTIFLISSNNAQEKPELQTQHTVLMQPDQYQFQSIGTNALPPGIHGSFLNGGPNSGPYPTALPQRLTQGFTTPITPLPDPVPAVPGRPVTPFPNTNLINQQPVSASPLTQFENEGFFVTPPASTLAENVISKPNEIVENNNGGQRNTVPILTPNPAPPLPPPPTEYNDYENFNYNFNPEVNYRDYPEYNEVIPPEIITEPGFHDLDPVATFHPKPTYTMTSDQFRPQYYEPPPPVHATHAPFVDDIIDILPGETLLTDPNLHCYERSCTQNITGRQVTYERALEIIQTEEYLTAADIDLIAYYKKNRRRKKRSPKSFVNPFSLVMGLASKYNPKKRPLHPHPYHDHYQNHYHYPNPYKMQHYKPYKHHHHVEVKEVPVVPPLIPLTVPQPGEPGGGAPPSAGDEEVLGLVPRGLRPVSVFPPYLFPRTVPAKCIIWAEPDPPLDIDFLEAPKKVMAKKSIFEQVKDFFGLDKLIPKPRGKYVKVVEVPAFERRYGFRCKVTLVDKQQCQVGISCDEFGNRLIRKRKRKKRQFVEFFSDAPPYCLTELSPLGCTPAI